MIKRLPLHIFLVSVFPSLALLSNNLGQTRLSVVHRPLIVSILIGLLLFLIARLFVKNWGKASLWTSFSILMFFSYGHIYQVVEDIQIFGFLIGRHRYLILIWVTLFFVGTLFILRRIKEVDEVTLILNLISLILIVFQLGQIAFYQIRKNVSKRMAETAVSDSVLIPEKPVNLPDVYLIVLDMYGREDALKVHYNYDNSEFLSHLQGLGFYVADCARSNYAVTVLSLASQLNLDYLDVLLETVDLESTSYLIKYSKVRKAFEEIGYTSIAFKTYYSWLNVDDSEIYIDKPYNPFLSNIDPFEKLFIEGTALRPFFDYYISLGFGEIEWFDTFYEMKAQRIRIILDHLWSFPQMDGPKFVYAHIMVPHPPHVFNRDGTVNLENDKYRSDKIEFQIQLDYMNPQIIEILRNIIENSDPEPIIILEGDHGLFEFERTTILNALYFPNRDVEIFYPQISLVNTFRLLFNEYFGTDFPLLEDYSYMRSQNNDYKYNPNPHEEWNPACIP